MSRTVYCLKLHKDAPGLTFAPYPGELGTKIFNNICQEAWQMWLSHQTLIINEQRLSLADPKARQMLATEMESFFFGSGSAAPQGFTPPTNKDS